MAEQDRFERILRALGITTLTRHHLPDHEIRTVRETVARDTHPLANVVAWDIPDEKQDALAKILDMGKAGLIREDLFVDLLIMLFPPRSQEELLASFKGFLTSDELIILRNAIAVDELMRVDRDRARALLASAERRFGTDARKIYNLYSAGFIAKLCVFERTMFIVQDERSAPRLFHEWFRRKLDFFEKAIFVNDYTSRDELREEVTRRIRARQDTIEIWGAGVSIIERIHASLVEYVGDRKTWDFTISLRQYAGGWGATFILYQIRSNPSFRPSRLERFWEFNDPPRLP